MVKLARRWVRSWPLMAEETTDRQYVVDRLPRLALTSVDYSSNPESWTVLRDAVLLEWDNVLEPADMLRFEEHIGHQPGRVHVAPYRVYEGSGYGRDGWLPDVPPGTEWAERFSFGTIWFPAAVVDRFRAAPHHPHAMWFTDGTFAAWYMATYGPAQVHWDVRSLHLNYRVELP